jgi:hypothetical protein
MRTLHRAATLAAFVLLLPKIASAQYGGPGPTAAPTPPPPTNVPGVELTSLRLMLTKGLITQAEYDSAVSALTETSGARAADSNTNFIIGKWSTTLYGFAEGDYIYDTTQSFNDQTGAALVARPTTYAGSNGRMQFAVRNSRIGLRFRAPEFHGIRASSLFEADFLGTSTPLNQSATPPGYQQTEQSFFTNPVPRIRHFYLNIETPIVDVLLGQTWHLFGWQGTYFPNTVLWQGLPGELYSRTEQLRITKSIKTTNFTFDVAVAAMRPPQRDSGVPEGEAGIHFAVNKWTATQTLGATGTTVAPLSIAVTGDARKVSVPYLNSTNAKPTGSASKSSGAIAVDLFLPVIPGRKEEHDNSLSLLGEFATGYGIVDMFTGLASGVTWPAIAPAAYNPQIDPGIVTYNSAGALQFIQYTSFRGGLQYYLPGLRGKMWIAGNFSRVESSNASQLGAPDATLKALDWFDALIMGDLTPAVRLGLEYANYNTEYGDAIHAIDHRVQLGTYYIF